MEVKGETRGELGEVRTSSVSQETVLRPRLALLRNSAWSWGLDRQRGGGGEERGGGREERVATEVEMGGEGWRGRIWDLAESLSGEVALGALLRNSAWSWGLDRERGGGGEEGWRGRVWCLAESWGESDVEDLIGMMRISPTGC